MLYHNIFIMDGTEWVTEHLHHSEGRMKSCFECALKLQINYVRSYVLLLHPTATGGRQMLGIYFWVAATLLTNSKSYLQPKAFF